MKTITKNTLQQYLKEATTTLLDMARNTCWNTISNHTSFIISEIPNDVEELRKMHIERKKINDKKIPKPLHQVATELELIYENLYDINLYVYKSEKDRTIVEIQYFPKSSLDPEFYKIVKENAPMVHCKIATPLYQNDKTKKYDVNWELGGIKYKSSMFWHRLKFNWKYRKQRKFDPAVMKRLLDELWLQSDNGSTSIDHIWFSISEVSKSTNKKRKEVQEYLDFLVNNKYLEMISEDPLLYSFTKDGIEVIGLKQANE
ncbi:hypothetical protein [Aquimarina sediminis]|uniref:hypothetical protein n=1 Tax=Aquimarina sediminis TaxID=2070536 RepID=UPI000CA00531|nr:hypothetical protein [Aquimarina sediminis]